MALVGHRCRSCEYYFLGCIPEGKVEICDYLEKTGKRRACPAGEKCTAYTKKIKRSRTDAYKAGIKRAILAHRGQRQGDRAEAKRAYCLQYSSAAYYPEYF